MEADEDAVEAIEFPHPEQPGSKGLGRKPEFRGPEAGLEEHMTDAHLAHDGHAIGLPEIHGLGNALFSGHRGYLRQDMPDPHSGQAGAARIRIYFWLAKGYHK